MTKFKFYKRVFNCEFEFWRKIKDFPLYEISNLGRVKSYYKNPLGAIRKQNLRNGYLYVELINEGERKNKNIHRLVAENFINNPENKTTVNHIDGNKLNNNINNLEWNTISENTLHAYRNGLIKLTDTAIKTRRKNAKIATESHKLRVMCVETGEIFTSLIEASKSVGLKGSSSLMRACKNPNKKAGGYHWRYID